MENIPQKVVESPAKPPEMFCTNAVEDLWETLSWISVEKNGLVNITERLDGTFSCCKSHICKAELY